jgi:hypothetical protein
MCSWMLRDMARPMEPRPIHPKRMKGGVDMWEVVMRCSVLIDFKNQELSVNVQLKEEVTQDSMSSMHDTRMQEASD